MLERPSLAKLYQETRESERKRKESVSKAGGEGNSANGMGDGDNAQIGPEQNKSSIIPCVLGLSHKPDTHASTRSLTHGYEAEDPLVPPNK